MAEDQDTRAWRPGDVANGHILTEDGRWVPHTPRPSRRPRKAAMVALAVGLLWTVGLAVAGQVTGGDTQPQPAATVAQPNAAVPTVPTTSDEDVDDEDAPEPGGSIDRACLSSEVGTGAECLDAAERFVKVYRAESFDFGTTDEAVAGVAGQVCVSVRNRGADATRSYLMAEHDISGRRASGLVEAAERQCRALGWW